MKQRVMYTEVMYAVGIIALALGTALMEKADFGLSMVVAPAYIIYMKLSATWNFVTFGMAEYGFQALLLIILALVLRRFKPAYLLSFLTAVIYGFILDFFMALTGMLDAVDLPARCALYVSGMLVCALGVACVFRTYLMPEAYELFVREISEKTGARVGRVKTVYDLTSCLIAAAMSLAFFGRLEGVKLGTVLCALINGKIISAICAFLDKRFVYKDRFRKAA